MMIALTGGGTGGHVFPALSVAAALLDRSCVGEEQIELRYLGLSNGPEAKLAPAEGLAFRSVRAGAMRGRNPFSMLWSGLNLLVGVVQAARALGGVDAVLATGGYAMVPVALAARMRGIPIVVYLPDVEPGWAVRFTARLATKIATTNEAAAAHLPAGKTVVTGYPVRPAFRNTTRERARRRMEAIGEQPLLLVSGASQGAQRVNEEIGKHLEELLMACRIVHVTGTEHERQFVARRITLPPELQPRYTVAGFMDDLPVAMLAADLAVMRAGASTLGELPAAKLPAVLVPYPHAGAHQRLNAEYLVEQGAAEVLDEGDIEKLRGLIGALLADPDRREQMAGKLEEMDRPGAACDIAKLVLSVAGGER